MLSKTLSLLLWRNLFDYVGLDASLPSIFSVKIIKLGSSLKQSLVPQPHNILSPIIFHPQQNLRDGKVLAVVRKIVIVLQPTGQNFPQLITLQQTLLLQQKL